MGLALARLGAQVTLTDKPPLLGLLRRNIARNWLSAPGARCASFRDLRGSHPRPGWLGTCMWPCSGRCSQAHCEKGMAIQWMLHHLCK